jgi:O-antigen ligase
MDIPGTNVLRRTPFVRLAGVVTLGTASVAFAAILCANGHYREAAVVAAAAIAAGFVLWMPISIGTLLIAWFVTTPLLSFYIRFPTDRSILTYNRVVFGLLIVALLVSQTRTGKWASLRSRFSWFEVAWALLSVLALASAAAQSSNVAYGTRMAVDTFWVPLVAFHLSRNHFRLLSNGKALLLGVIVLAFFLFVTGVLEFGTGVDLFAYKGSEIVREGERRVNGPFATDSSYAIICLMFFLFLLAAPRMFRLRFDRSGKLVYALALASAALGALLPAFRAVALALIICWIVMEWAARRGDARPPRHKLPVGSLIVATLVFAAALAAAVAPSVFVSRLTSARTAFGRLATWKAAVDITLSEPVFGVGLGNYSEAYDATHYYADQPDEEVLEVRAAQYPHSNLLWVGAELGLTGLALYVVANFYLFLMGWRVLKNATSPRRRAAAACLIAILVAYWIPGLTLASGYYSDLNLYFFFLAGALLNPSSGHAADTKV